MKDFIRKKLITELINKNTITCDKCNWKWDKSDSEEKDLYICHKCGHDNEPLKENLQQADNIYFNTGALSPKVKEIITTRITNGDVYTKFICDVYYAELQQQHSIGDWVVNSNDNPK